jgi:magnesium chelatase subunit D
VIWTEKLRRLFARNRGARLGEAAVISRLCHARDSSRPQGVILLMGADAGQVLYGRRRPGEVLHLDLFHAEGQVDHWRVATALLEALGQVQGVEGRPLLDWFDLQTATGGGRVTGDLSWGRKESLRRNHLTHVHLSGLLADDQLHLLAPIVRAVEEAVLAEGLELRRIERLAHLRTGHSAAADLSPYSDRCDSLLKESGQTGRSARWDHRAGEAGTGGRSGGQRNASGRLDGPGGAHGRSDEPCGSISSAPVAEADLDQVMATVKQVGSPDELLKLLRDLDQADGWTSLGRSEGLHAVNLLRDLEAGGYLVRNLRGPALTEEGRRLLHLLETHLRAIKLRFRRLIRRASTPGSLRPAAAVGEARAQVRTGAPRGAVPAQPGEWLGEIAVLETVRGAVTRAHLAGDASHLTLRREDVWLRRRTGERPLHICLLIDASASMAGRRILAAKHLARHLLSTTKDKLAVVSFQERDVKVHVPFTRDWALVEAGLAGVQPMGLTPLAHGLSESLDLIRQTRARRPLLLLVTDGIPTVAKWSLDPQADGLKAARLLSAAGVPFGCIGLQPSRRYLTDLCEAADGSLHIVDELDADALVAIAQVERRKLARRLRQGMGARRAKPS